MLEEFILSFTQVETNNLALEKIHALNPHSASYIGIQIAVIACLAVIAHFLVRLLRFVSDWLIRKSAVKKSPVGFVTQQPKFVTLTGLITSALTLVIYSIGLGFILNVLGMNTQQFIATYLATASVVGFAVGFGSQGLVQDVITGVTLIFTDTLEVGDLVEISGQVGRVESVGLRFTELRNFYNQQVFLSNRNIANIARYPRGGVHAYVDVQIPANADKAKAVAAVNRVAKGMWEQFKAIILREPELSDVHPAKPDEREFLRVQFKIWPGQGPLIENTFRQRVIDALKQLDPNYADWMVVVTYRAIDLGGTDVSI
jgi:small conductance mechanosensitive channel